MREDRPREFVAVPVILVLLGILFLIALLAELGTWGWVLFGVGAAVGIALVFVLLARRPSHPSGLDAPSTTARRAAVPNGAFRVVVVADDACTGPALAQALVAHAAGRTLDVLVVAPALGSRMSRWTGDDRSREEAAHTLADTLGALEAAGLSARGEVGAGGPDRGGRRRAARVPRRRAHLRDPSGRRGQLAGARRPRGRPYPLRRAGGARRPRPADRPGKEPGTDMRHPRGPLGPSTDLSVPSIFSHEAKRIPRHRLPEGELPPDVAYQIIHDELMLDGNARLNLATFVTTWMEPQAEALMAECFDKNMIDKDEYPQTAELEMRCVNMPRRTSGTRPTPTRRRDARPPGRARRRCSAASRSSAAGSTRRQRGGQADRLAEHRHGHQRPGLLGEVRQLLGRRDAARPDGGRPPPSLRGGGREALRREHDRRRRDARLDVRRLLRAGAGDLRGARRPAGARPGSTSRCTSTGRPGAFIAPFLDPDLVWDFRLAARRLDQRLGPQVRARLPGRRLGRVAGRGGAARRPDLLGQLPRRQHAHVRAQLLPARAPRSSAQYYNFLRLGFEGYRAGAAATPATSPRGCRARSRSSGPFELLTRGDELPVFAFRSPTASTTSPSSTSRARCASAAGSSPPTRSRRTGRTSPRCASSSSAASATTWPTCWCDDLQPAAAPPGEAARARSTTPTTRRASTTSDRCSWPRPPCASSCSRSSPEPARSRWSRAGRAHQPAGAHERPRLCDRVPDHPGDRLRRRLRGRLGGDDRPQGERDPRRRARARPRARPARPRLAAETPCLRRRTAPPPGRKRSWSGCAASGPRRPSWWGACSGSAASSG